MDPTLSASTFPFGSQQNRGKSAAVDSAWFRPNSHRELGSSYKLLGPAPPLETYQLHPPSRVLSWRKPACRYGRSCDPVDCALACWLGASGGRTEGSWSHATLVRGLNQGQLLTIGIAPPQATLCRGWSSMRMSSTVTSFPVLRLVVRIVMHSATGLIGTEIGGSGCSDELAGMSFGTPCLAANARLLVGS
jgi:hypothetical protein